MVEEQGVEQSIDSGALDVISRVRTLEGKYNLLRDRALIINQNMITQYQKTSAELKTIEEDLQDIKHTIFQIKETLKHLVQEMEGFARRDEIKILEKYINLWNPMKFVTEEEVKKLIEELTGKRGSK